MAQRSPTEEAVLKEITPGELPTFVHDTIKQVQAKLSNADVMLGGSAAKKTNLADDHDLDVFVLFPKSAKNISDVLAEALENAERVHGSRDYFHLHVKDYTFEFVPVLKIKTWKQAKNVTDMSPLHVAYVQRHPQFVDDIRLTKQFCKAAKVYGAESYIGGFSGHVVELLTIHYGGFRELLAAAASWKDKTILDPEQQLKNPEKQLNKSKTLAPLIIVDPVDPSRNSAAAVTREKYDRFRKQAKAYLASSGKEFFTIKKITKKDVQHPGTNVIEVALTPLKGKRDVVGAKCNKVFEYLLRQLKLHDFFVQKSAWEFHPDHAILLFAIEKEPLGATHEILGPPTAMKEDVARFKERHEQTFVRHDRMYATEQRRFTDATKLLAHVCTQPYVTQRVKHASVKK